MNEILKQKIIDDIENIINEDKDYFYLVVLDIKSGHFDFPPEYIFELLDLLFEEIKEKILKG
jgi:hypothetical protein